MLGGVRAGANSYGPSLSTDMQPDNSSKLRGMTIFIERSVARGTMDARMLVEEGSVSR